jgi:hypothetical protein
VPSRGSFFSVLEDVLASALAHGKIGMLAGAGAGALVGLALAGVGIVERGTAAAAWVVLAAFGAFLLTFGGVLYGGLAGALVGATYGGIAGLVRGRPQQDRPSQPSPVDDGCTKGCHAPTNEGPRG